MDYVSGTQHSEAVHCAAEAAQDAATVSKEVSNFEGDLKMATNPVEGIEEDIQGLEKTVQAAAGSIESFLHKVRPDSPESRLFWWPCSTVCADSAVSAGQRVLSDAVHGMLPGWAVVMSMAESWMVMPGKSLFVRWS